MYELTLLLCILSCSCRRKRFRWVCRRLRSDRGLAHTRWSPSHSALRCTDRCNCRRNLRRTRRTAYFMQNDCKTRSRRWDIARKMSASKQSAAFISATHKTNKQTNKRLADAPAQTTFRNARRRTTAPKTQSIHSPKALRERMSKREEEK